MKSNKSVDPVTVLLTALVVVLVVLPVISLIIGYCIKYDNTAEEETPDILIEENIPNETIEEKFTRDEEGNVVIPELVEEIVHEKTEDVDSKYLSECEDLMNSAEFEIVYAYKTLYGVNMLPYIERLTIDEAGMLECVYAFENTDATLHITLDTVTPNSGYSFGDCANKYGSDYGVIYFTNGLPVNSMDIYQAIFENTGNLSGTTDYVTGDTTITITGVDGEAIISELEL